MHLCRALFVHPTTGIVVRDGLFLDPPGSRGAAQVCSSHGVDRVLAALPQTGTEAGTFF